MVYCVQALLLFNDTAQRDLALADITVSMSTKRRWGATTAEGRDYKGRPSINLEVRFNDRADASDLKTYIEGISVGLRQPRAGSRVYTHECTHDEPSPRAGVIDSERAW